MPGEGTSVAVAEMPVRPGDLWLSGQSSKHGGWVVGVLRVTARRGAVEGAGVAVAERPVRPGDLWLSGQSSKHGGWVVGVLRVTPLSVAYEVVRGRPAASGPGTGRRGRASCAPSSPGRLRDTRGA